MQRSILALAAVAAALSPNVALADTWFESGPEVVLGPTTGQVTNGVGALTAINGSLNGVGFDLADMYTIRITDPVNFTATTQGGATFDTQLFLFDSTYHGVTHRNNDGASPQTTIGGAPAPGLYNLAISISDLDPLGPSGLQIWEDFPNTVPHPPDGPAAAEALASWTFSQINGTPGPYVISLTGAGFAIPEPGGLLLLAVGAVAGLRRRR